MINVSKHLLVRKITTHAKSEKGFRKTITQMVISLKISNHSYVFPEKTFCQVLLNYFYWKFIFKREEHF